MFDIHPIGIPGCYEIQPKVQEDLRGHFVKVFHKGEFEKRNLEVEFAEEYYSYSKKGVIRGMHFQTPPCDHFKLVYCPFGEIFDVVVDLRLGSPTYGQARSINLSARAANYIYIPKGIAHGFCVKSDSAILVYKLSSTYSPKHDSGLLWSSVEVDWPEKNPTISERDQKFSWLSDFESPFIYES
jgi:dTDP-4-dehydrorhamnose 3,5-epimerase